MENSSHYFEKLISRIRNGTQFAKAFEDGYKPADIKLGVIDLLSPYFSNKEVLKKGAVNFLMSDAIAFAHLSTNKTAFDLFEYALSIHKHAYTQDKVACIQTSIEWLPVIYEGLSIYWSQFNLEIDKKNLPDDEFLFECLRNIGAITEGVTKHLIKELLQQQRVANGDYLLKGGTKGIKFGVAVDELLGRSPDKKFFTPEGVRLNQWRNIAQHLSARVEGANYICVYGDPEREICLTRTKLYQLTKHIFDLFSGLKLANSFFSFDHMNELIAAGLKPEDIQIRGEMNLLNIVSGLLSQGFEVVDFQVSEQESKLIIRDMTSLDPDVRRIHTSQFVELVWHFSKSKKVCVEYIERDGTPNFSTSAFTELFEKIEKENLDPSIIARESEMIDLKNNIVIPKSKN